MELPKIFIQMKNKSFFQKLAILLLLSLLPINKICAQTDSIPTEYIEFRQDYRLPEVKTSMSDTILERFLVLDINDIQSISALVVISDYSESIYTSDQLLSDSLNFEIKDDEIYINTGKADQNIKFYILGSEEGHEAMPLLNTDNYTFIFSDSLSVIPPIE
jgi:hypothetical protein